MIKDKLFSEIKQNIIEGEKEEALVLAKEAVTAGLDLSELIEKGCVPGIQKVGDLWEKGEYFLPELISSAECMKAVMELLHPELEKSNIVMRSEGRIIIGTVEGDIHDIGKNLVSSILSANGFDVYDLGGDVKLEKFIEKADELNADCICLSALLTTTMLGQKKLIEVLKEKNITRFKVMVGGAPVNQIWANTIGADGYAENALSAVNAVKKVLST